MISIFLEYLFAFGDIDNIIGMMPVAMLIACVLCAAIVLFVKPVRRNIPVLTALVIFAVLSAALLPTAVKGNWWINMTIAEGQEAGPDLTAYAPFSFGSKTAKLDEEPTLKISGKLPRLDGATALYPVYAAFAEAVYLESNFSQDDVACTNTINAYNSIISGERDIIFVAGASERQVERALSAGADLKFTPIGREAFVFLVGKNNPIDNITVQQIRNIYSGKTARWGTLGWREGGRIIAFQRPEGSGSQTGLLSIMGGLPVQAPQPLPDPSLIGTNSLMAQVSLEWGGVQPAIGYSYRYYATTMYENPDAKLLKVNGIEPSLENIRNGSYPFVADFFAVTNGEPQGNSKLLIDWILSAQGQEIIEKTGYTPR